ncbi:hypothetical protein [Amycolatopsis sp. NBC_01480]|uniref:hypothetical protein n=1 Tax=Amycolatopsis sp. NBC_01480 TaxID=2903562 RepID=UPI002E2B6B37|nr:hypothetical protein [Amycolatopsis sp. NBC_01480]
MSSQNAARSKWDGQMVEGAARRGQSGRRTGVVPRGGGVRWRLIDRVLANYEAESVLALLGAAIDSPVCRLWERQLLLLWARAVRLPPRGSVEATSSDLVGLVEQAVRAAPDRVSNGYFAAVDARSIVRHEIAGRRLRVHPGDHVHPQVFLRSVSMTAAVIDPVLVPVRGFGLADVMEVVLGHSDKLVSALAPAWPGARPDGPAFWEAAEPVVSEAEIAVVRDGMAVGPEELVTECRYPARAAAALTWLTRPASAIKVASRPTEPALGPTLVVDGGSRSVFVPAALTMATLAAATRELADQAAESALSHHRLNAVVQRRVVRVLMGHTAVELTEEAVDDAASSIEARWVMPPDEPVSAVVRGEARRRTEQVRGRLLDPEVVQGPRHATVIVSGLGSGDLGLALDWADYRWARESADRPEKVRPPVRLVIYGGPAVLAAQQITDTVRLHVEELVEILADAQGDQILLACFLDDLYRPDSETPLFLDDVLDAWSVWRRRGYLVPPVDFDGVWEERYDQPDDLPWARAAAWEPIEQLLSDAAVPASVGWPVARLSQDGDEADLFDRGDGIALLVRRDPGIVIYAFLGEAEQLGMSPDALFGFADGVRVTVGRAAAISSHLNLGDRVPLSLALRLLPEAASVHDQEIAGVPYRVGMSADRAVIEIGIVPEAMSLFQGDGLEGHSALGFALYEAVARLRQARGDVPGLSREEFSAAWDSCPPVTTVAFVESDTPALPEPDALPRGPHMRMRAIEAVARTVRQRGIPSGSYTGESAVQVCREHLLQALEDALVARARTYRPSLVDEVLRRLNAAYATRFVEQATIARSLAGPFADNWIEHALAAEEGAAATRPLEVLFEYVLAYPPGGDRDADVLDVADLVALADLVLSTATRIRTADQHLSDFAVLIADGVFAFTDEPNDADADLASQGFDHDAYSRARRDQQVFLARAASPAAEPGDRQRMPIYVTERSPQPFAPFHDVADEILRQADDGLRGATGTGLDAIRAVLHTAQAWPVGNDGLARVEPGALVADATAWSRLPDTEVNAALETLTLDRETLEPLSAEQVADLEDRPDRLPLRPLPMVNGVVLIGPWIAHAGLTAYVTYLMDSRLPPLRALPQHLLNLMQRRRQQQNNELEDEVSSVVNNLGLPRRFRFTQGDAVRAGIPAQAGEIDLLVADVEHCRLWVCEIKDPQAAYSPPALFRHIRSFVKGDGHVAKLLSKADVIGEHARQAAKACGVEDDLPWRVVPLLVTRWVEPAAFIAHPRVASTVLDRLAAVLGKDSDPDPLTSTYDL